MNYQLRTSLLAVKDIEDVLDFTLEQFGEGKCEEYKSLIRQALVEIAADPTKFPAKHRTDIHANA
jgi:plasmid stabilization system protein ParE